MTSRPAPRPAAPRRRPAGILPRSPMPSAALAALTARLDGDEAEVMRVLEGCGIATSERVVNATRALATCKGK